MSKELEYIQRNIDIVKQQVKCSKMKIIVTDAVTKHQYDYYENELQTLESIEKALQRLEAIDNANPSEAFETVYNNIDYLISDIVIEDDEVNGCLMTIKEHLPTIKQALLKAQEHNYLKWKDLEFKKQQQVMDVLLNGKPYVLYFYKLSTQSEVNMFSVDMHIVTLNSYYPEDVKFFNDLHLERVEE